MWKNRRELLWTEQMIYILRRYYPYTDTREVAGMIGVSRCTVVKKAHQLGLRKNRQYITELRSRSGKLGVMLREIKKKKKNGNRKKEYMG